MRPPVSVITHGTALLLLAVPFISPPQLHGAVGGATTKNKAPTSPRRAVPDTIFAAAKRGDLQAVLKFLDAGTDINKRDADRNSPLIHAAREGQAAVVKTLLRRHALTNLTDNRGLTASQWADILQHRDIVAMIAAVDAENANLRVAAERGDTAEVLASLGRDANVNAQDHHGCTALFLAAAAGHRDTAQALLDNGADPSLEETFSGWGTPALMAAREGHTDVMNLLMTKGACRTARCVSADVLLQEAASGGHVDTARFLLDAGANVHAQNDDGQTALHFASIWGHADVIQLLVDRGADVNAKEKDGATPIYQAVFNGNADAVKALIKNGADVKARFSGQGLLTIAVAHSYQDIRGILREAGVVE